MSSYKRSRATFESDQHAPYAVFGTPLPDEIEARDDGSYLPLWKQDVRDEQGRKRLHGAFTGGFSAGYFNTVGSKEGWTPSTFVSSRSKRNKSDQRTIEERAQDFMDDEDLADAAEAQQLKSTQAFAGFGSSGDFQGNSGGLAGLLKTDGDTMGLKLLRKMGWKDGQGIGPKVRRTARLESSMSSKADDSTYLFAPDDTDMIRFVRKIDRMGLGYQGEAKLGRSQPENGSDREDEDDSLGPAKISPSRSRSKDKPKAQRGGMGVGILNDNGSDDEDPYEMGPNISYNRVIGGDKKRKKKVTAAANPSLGVVPVFLSKGFRAGKNLRRCHDGRLPLDGFVLAKMIDDLTALSSKYAPPEVPEGWTWTKSATCQSGSNAYQSTADASKESTLDPKSRAAILGERALPGKSVFDFLSSSARDQLAKASGKTNLPPGLGEVPAEYALTEEEKSKALWEQVPKVDKDTAIAAIARGSSGPYADDERKRERYRAYLEHGANQDRPLPTRLVGLSDDDYLREMTEFYNCARIFKPMTGFMASRFTTAKTQPGTADGKSSDVVSQPGPEVTDPAEDAAKVGMYGKLTRSVRDFYPSRLLCKRFNVRAPAHSQPNDEADSGRSKAAPHEPSQLLLTSGGVDTAPEPPSDAHIPAVNVKAEPAKINPETNDAVEASAASQDLLKAESGTGPLASPESVETLVHRERRAAAHHESASKRPPSIADHEVVEHSPPPPQYPVSEPSSSSRPPPFSSLFASVELPERPLRKFHPTVACEEAIASGSVAAPAYSSSLEESTPFDPDQGTGRAFQDPVQETKRALPSDTKAESSGKDDDTEPPPAYTEGDSPLQSFTFLMAAAGGTSSIITQVQQGGPPINSIGDVGADETIVMDLRGTRFVLTRDELLTLPEFVLLSLFPNGLFPEGHMGGPNDDAVQVDYDPVSLQYMLGFFRDVAQSIPIDSEATSNDGDSHGLDSRDDASKRAGIIVLREDLDFYVIPPKADITHEDMIKVKRAAAQSLQKQDGIFSGLKRSDEPGTTEAHLIEMLTAGGFNHDDCWGHRAGEPNKAVICSLALTRLRSDIRGSDLGNNAMGMAQKLLLFWRKPARRCWWEGIELDNVDGVQGQLKVWIRRVWTLEMSVIGLR
ncbi:G-patch domain protein, putative [Cordyceps militaris CM01]|uniref:G-patch domain protein, putative n=1 Tax=Cordyceps militaris (strain CM01) TaxID=983644 RepID=G3J3L9_CORMM|nr:G-patch domain protein, putative [Cordyceps militaris CM01]EGX95695.1 G-patch domain protein, putative [Cordyceps militaris CM01]